MKQSRMVDSSCRGVFLWRRSFIVSVLLAGTVSFVFAGNTGKIAGKVTDAKTKEPLIGANVAIPGTSLGASTDVNGDYTILNIPPNTYALRASILGYDPVTVNGIQVSIDLTTRQDFSLSETVVEQKEVVITAERRVIQKDLTATTAVVGKDQIAMLPVNEVGQVLQLQSGITVDASGGIHVRGGRSSEVAYWVDGIPITDGYDGSQIVEVNKNLVQEMQLVSGAFNAEYGQAMSGIVNIATKEGGPKYTGSIGSYGGQYLANDNTLYPGLDRVRPTSIRDFEGNLSGPLAGDNLTFFANGRYIYFDGDLQGYQKYNPWNISYTDPITRKFYLFRDSAGLGDGGLVPMNSSERWYGQGKLTWKISPVMKLNTDYIYDHTKSQPYNRMYFYNPAGNGQDYNYSNTVILQFTHTLSSNTFYTLGASYFDKTFRHYLYDLQYNAVRPNTSDTLLGNVGDLIEAPNQGQNYVHPNLFLTDDPYSFYTGGTDLSRFKRSTITKVVKFDVTSQVNTTNLVKFGLEFRRHNIFYESVQLQPVIDQTNISMATASPFIRTRILPDSSNSHDVYNHTPTEFSTYIQDKLEFRDFILNVGIRFDYFEPDGVVLNDSHPDPSDPLHYMYTVDDPSIYTPVRDDHTADPLSVRKTYWYKKASAKTQFSPRLGGSFPISATGVFHFSYGHFFQIPQFERLYENPDFKLGFGTGNQGIIGNADLNPEQTINGELGVQQQLTEDVSVDLTAYMRDIRGLTGTRADQIIVFGGSRQYSKYVNSDFGTVKGIGLTLSKRFSGGFSSTLDYTYQVAHGSASDPVEARNAILGGSQPEVQLVPLAWDQRQTINVTTAYSSKDWGVSFIGQYGSGFPYTPRRSADITALLTNSQYKPSSLNIDARVFYNVSIDALKFVVYSRIINLLDTRNELNVFDDTGRAGFTTDEERVLALNTRQRVNSVQDWFTVPTNFSEPRRIEIGVNWDF
jgi:outer membrane receptor for ferrienterochelin and colicin